MIFYIIHDSSNQCYVICMMAVRIGINTSSRPTATSLWKILHKIILNSYNNYNH